MDPVTIMVVSASFAASCVAQKCADEVVEKAWGKIRERIKAARGKEPAPSDIASCLGGIEKKTGGGEVIEAVESVLGHSSALRRAKFSESMLTEVRILWVDDHPENNSWERVTFTSLKMDVVPVLTTQDALKLLAGESFDIIISDILREESQATGLLDLPKLRKASPMTPVVFYVGSVDASQGIPPNSFGITDDPEELLHLLLDIMERKRR